ncbi:U32 family peptidase [Miniphocaeibacter massiliensis]|uniref:U32 family peptidase n=1 Tax=Miniphocaeibacter massiliensis TaxID=2041841 RepID=UPI000C08BA59|nr:U32 family peptidase [Miniphocaeibacter massiliensis]
MKDYDFEVLAPVGNNDMLIAAIKAGADAIYLGGKLFSARAYAENFTTENMKNIVNLCHKNNVKVYVTVNTLLHDYELNEALNYVIDLYNSDVDAVIIQDLGLLKLIKQYLPDMEVHASTQINIYNYFGAKMMKELGFSRVVLARETPIDEIRYISENVDIELEVFIHGSLCVATSGQCLMSSYIGGRSGNRGKCAQPCRKEYQVYDSNFEIESKDKDYKSFLSPKDLCTIDTVVELRDIGVKSFKIEGRMKKPEYVYSVVKTYKSKLLKEKINIEVLEEVSNRGFTKGLLNYDYGKNFIEIDRKRNKKGIEIGVIVSQNNKTGILLYKQVYKGDILLIETKKGKVIQYTLTDDYKAGDIIFENYFYDAKIKAKVRRTSSIKLKEELKNKVIDYKRTIEFKFIGKIGKNPRLYAKYKNLEIEDEVEHTILPAISQPMEKEKISEQLSKLGNTDYTLNKIEFDIDENIFIPVKKLNELRREIIIELDNYINNFNDREFKNYVTIEFEKLKHRKESNTLINIEYINIDKEIDNEFGEIYSNLPLKNTNKYYFKIPRFSTTDNLSKLENEIAEIEKNIEGFLVNNIGDIEFIRQKFPTKKIVGDLGLNVLNSKTYKFLEDLGLERITLSTELNLDEINSMLPFINTNFEIIVYGYLTSMIIRNCPFSSIKGCKNDLGCKSCKYSKNHYLKDENNEYFLVNRYNNYSELYNSKLLNSYDLIGNINFENSGNIRLIINEEDANLIKLFNNKINKNKNGKNLFDMNKYTKGHFNRGIN